MSLFHKELKKSTEVFGISTDILPNSYIDRGSLDSEIQRQLTRSNHIALRGESKCGKSWIRKKNIPNALVIQCRLKKDVSSIYRDILSELGISVLTEKTSTSSSKGSIEVGGELGLSLIAKLKGKVGIEIASQGGNKFEVLGKGPNDLRFVCEAIKASGRRVVIEDFHYMSVDDR